MILKLLVIHLVALISPGPDLALILKNSLHKKENDSYWIAFGFSIGILFHVSVSFVALKGLFNFSDLIKVMKILGGSYLTYLGLISLYGVFRDKKSAPPQDQDQKQTQKHPFLLGLLTNLSNPKVTIYLMSLFTIYLHTLSSMDLLITGLSFSALTFLWFSFVGLILGQEAVRRKFLSQERLLNFCFGVFFVFLGFTTLI